MLAARASSPLLSCKRGRTGASAGAHHIPKASGSHDGHMYCLHPYYQTEWRLASAVNCLQSSYLYLQALTDTLTAIQQAKAWQTVTGHLGTSHLWLANFFSFVGLPSSASATVEIDRSSTSNAMTTSLSLERLLRRFPLSSLLLGASALSLASTCGPECSWISITLCLACKCVPVPLSQCTLIELGHVWTNCGPKEV